MRLWFIDDKISYNLYVCQRGKNSKTDHKKDEKALLSFYRAHHASILQFIYKQVGQKDVAEELTQDSFLDFIEGLRNFRGESTLKTYLFSIARFKIIDYIKKKK